jgi:hypothetical protein
VTPGRFEAASGHTCRVANSIGYNRIRVRLERGAGGSERRTRLTTATFSGPDSGSEVMGENTIGTGEDGTHEDERWRDFDARFRPRHEDSPPGEDSIRNLVKVLCEEELSHGRDPTRDLGLAPDRAEETTRAEEKQVTRNTRECIYFKLIAAAPVILILLYFLYRSSSLGFLLLAILVTVVWRKLMPSNRFQQISSYLRHSDWNEIDRPGVMIAMIGTPHRDVDGLPL